MHMVSLVEVDVSEFPGGYSFEVFRDELASRAAALPEFRAKIEDSRFNVDNPVWVEDPNFHIDRHIRRIQLPAPGGSAELSAIAAELAAEPLDRDRPLWSILVIEGLGGSTPSESGHIALGNRSHHVFADGVTSGNLWAQLLEPAVGAAAAQPVAGFGAATSWQIAKGGLARFAKRPWFFLSKIMPATLAGILASIRRSVRGQSMSSPFRAPMAVFNGRIGTRRALGYVRISLDDVKIVKNAFGVRVNDVMLALLSGALRKYLLARSALPTQSLVVMMPVSVYEEGQQSRNQLSGALLPLHTDIADPADRLRGIAAASSVAKEHASQLGTSIVEDWLQLAPVSMKAVLRLGAAIGRRPAYTVSFSNVLSTQDRIMGAPLVSSYPFGPVMDGVGLNVSAATLNGQIDFGFASCSNLLPDIAELAASLPSILEELLAAAKVEVDGR